MFNIDVRINCEITEIKRDEKCVVSKDGEKFYYDKLVLAHGANHAKPPIEGIEDKNILTLRTLDDADRINN